VTDDVRLPTAAFHRTDRPQGFVVSFQFLLYSSPFKPFVPVHIPLEASFQYLDQFLALLLIHGFSTLRLFHWYGSLVLGLVLTVRGQSQRRPRGQVLLEGHPARSEIMGGFDTRNRHMHFSRPFF
jgi:hypothetical protein